MWNYRAEEILAQQIQEQKLRKSEVLWELERARTEALKQPLATTWLRKIKAYFKIRTPKLQQKIN